MMWLILAVYLFLVVAHTGDAKPYCRWQTDKATQSEKCFETADTEEPGAANATCADEAYTDLIANVRYCFNRQSETFEGCLPGTEPEPDVCDDFAIGPLTAEDDHNGPKPSPRICVPGNLEIPQNPRPEASNLRLLLRSLNVCEGRSTNRSMTPNEEHLTISAPCTCAGVNETADVAMSPPCQARKLALAENATLECSYCDNVWNTWLNDYLRRGDCRLAARAAAPIQALCRDLKTKEECEKFNVECGGYCGGPNSTAGPLPSPAPVPTHVESSDAVASMADINSSAATAAEEATAEPAEGPTSSAAAGRRPSAARIAFAAAAACTLMHAAVAF